MKNFLFVTIILLCSHLALAQSYSTVVSAIPSSPGSALFWESDTDQATLKFMAIENGFIGNIKKGKIFMGNELLYRVEQKGDRYFLANSDRKTQLVMHPKAYMALDGIELKRLQNGAGDKISIIHPDGRVIAEGKIKSKLLADPTLVITVLEPNHFSQEIAAMLSVDLLEHYREKAEWLPNNYTAELNP